jgi:hypothetical protein
MFYTHLKRCKYFDRVSNILNLLSALCNIRFKICKINPMFKTNTIAKYIYLAPLSNGWFIMIVYIKENNYITLEIYSALCTC